MATSFCKGLWRLADPKISLASISSVFLGSAIAVADGPLHWGWLAVTVAGILAIEVAKNAAGEIVDYDSGTDVKVAPGDRSPFSGGKRVMVRRASDPTTDFSNLGSQLSDRYWVGPLDHAQPGAGGPLAGPPWGRGRFLLPRAATTAVLSGAV